MCDNCNESSFTCICGKAFKSKRSLGVHKQRCIEVLRQNGKLLDNYICSGCHREFKSLTSLQAHLTHCTKYEKQTSRTVSVQEFDGIHCQYGCGKEAKFILKNGIHCCSEYSTQCEVNRKHNSEGLHNRYDKLRKAGVKRIRNYDYNSLPQETKDKMAWNRGLTKETDERVAKNGQAVSKSLKDGYASGRLQVSDETRIRLSSKRKKYLAEHPEKHPSRLVCSNKNHMTYPEQVVYDWLNANSIKFESQFHWVYYQKDGSKHNRYVDFALLDKKIFIEVDGNFWHKDKKDIDEAKDLCAKTDGFNTLRIDPSKSIIDQLSSYF